MPIGLYLEKYVGSTLNGVPWILAGTPSWRSNVQQSNKERNKQRDWLLFKSVLSFKRVSNVCMCFTFFSNVDAD